MSSGRINSAKSLQMAAKVIAAFGGSWQALENASELRDDGVRVIRRSAIEKARRESALIVRR